MGILLRSSRLSERRLRVFLSQLTPTRPLQLLSQLSFPMFPSTRRLERLEPRHSGYVFVPFPRIFELVTDNQQVVFVLMFISTLAFYYLAFRVPVQKRLFHVITALIT